MKTARSASPARPRRARAAAARHGETLREQLRGFLRISRDPAFWRAAICIGASQAAAVSLGTLWVATWLRDVGGYSQAEVARALLLFAVAMIGGYIAFGQAADAAQRRCGSTVPLLAGGIAAASLCLALLALGVHVGSLVLWSVFFALATGAVLAYPLLGRRYPKEMAGRVNTALNVFVFVGMFSGQWTVGLILNLWPSEDGSEAAARDPRRLGVLEQLALNPARIRREHHDVARYALFEAR